ncbi:MAG: hypothetical protein K6G10_02950 [Butyrivibrio sp.]|nr:hypothetical protein [Butyrivibrio sp.]
MNDFLNNMERKFGKYAVKNLTIYIIGCYILGYILQLAPMSVNFSSFLYLDPALILQGQVWRLVSWILIPPDKLSIWIIITLYLYYFIGTTMERTIGTFRYNVFIFGGMLLMIISAFVTYAFYLFVLGVKFTGMGVFFTTEYLQMAVFLSFALSYPDLQLLLMFIIPIKVKYLGIVYSVILGFNAVYYGLIHQIYPIFFAILFQFINLVLFYLQTGRADHFRPSEVKRRQEFKKSVKITPPGVTRHKCAVCGRTEQSNPELEFRFCSKCNGNYEYCQDHLFTHQHVQ